MMQDPGKREAKQFEPPPWEREAFERLAREREQVVGPPAEEEPEAEAQAGEVAPEAATAVEPEQEAQGAKAPSEPAIEAMILALKEEEPASMTGVWKVALAVGAVLTTMGLMLIVWAAVGLARTVEAGPVGWFGASIMGVMGAGFVAVGLWLGARSLRKQGVL